MIPAGTNPQRTVVLHPLGRGLAVLAVYGVLVWWLGGLLAYYFLPAHVIVGKDDSRGGYGQSLNEMHGDELLLVEGHPERGGAWAAAVRQRVHDERSALDRLLLWWGFAGLPIVPGLAFLWRRRIDDFFRASGGQPRGQPIATASEARRK